jgi:hypothetical protein
MNASPQAGPAGISVPPNGGLGVVEGLVRDALGVGAPELQLAGSVTLERRGASC